MRRKIFSNSDEELIDDILNRVSYGTLAMYDGTPYAIPVNFSWFKKRIIFHGALKGRKAKILLESPEVAFTVVEEYSYIPSYFTPENSSACPATQFFKSVMLEGHANRITGRGEMAEALESLMQKHQPEKKYVDWKHEMYDKSLEGVLVMEIIPTSISAKFKFGQNEKREKMEHTLKMLEDRGTDLDLETIKWIKRFSD
jgi:hypothetical protein